MAGKASGVYNRIKKTYPLSPPTANHNAVVVLVCNHAVLRKVSDERKYDTAHCEICTKTQVQQPVEEAPKAPAADPRDQMLVQLSETLRTVTGAVNALAAEMKEIKSKTSDLEGAVLGPPSGESKS